jgi:pyrrolidone-carboxylate peptidase
LGVACGADPESQEQDVIVRTKTEAEWRQYVTNVEFASRYEPSCATPQDGRPRVLVTGFGRFLENAENATGRMVSALVAGLEYPETSPPEGDAVDDPAAQTRVLSKVVALDGVGEVVVCGMILPVFWDLAAILVLKESEVFRPDFVLMNGIAGDRQPLWLELGSVNEAVSLPDGSGTLAPIEAGTKLLSEVPDEDRARGLLLSWSTVRGAVEEALEARSEEVSEGGVTFGAVAQGVRFATFPRESNTYLCNNTTYAVNYVFDHPGRTFRLLEPSDPRELGPSGVDVSLSIDLSRSPRVFVHWPKEIGDGHVERGAAVMRALLGAQLAASQPAWRGTPAMGDADL